MTTNNQKIKTGMANNKDFMAGISEQQSDYSALAAPSQEPATTPSSFTGKSLSRSQLRMVSTLVVPKKWYKLKFIALKTDTTVKAMLDGFLDDAIAAYEAEHGEII